MIIFISILWFLAFFAIFGIIGFVFFHFLCGLFKKETPIAIEWVPLYVFLGLILTEIVFFLLSFVYVDIWVSYIYVAVFMVCFLQLVLKKYKVKILSEKNAFFKQEKYRINGIIFTFIFILVLFCYIAFIIDFAPPGDAIDHATVVSIIIENKKFPGDYSPVDDMVFSVLRYPPGFRVLSVFTALFSSSYPIVAIAFTGTISSCLIPLLIWSSIYVRTRSIALSLLGLCCALILPYGVVTSPLEGNDLVLGNLVCGTYPNQLAFLELIGLAAFLTNYGTLNRNPTKDSEGVTQEKGSSKMDVFLFLGITLIGFSLILAHYLFTFFVLALFGIKFLIIIGVWVKKIFEKTELKKRFLFKIGIGIGILCVGIVTIYGIIYIVPILTNIFSFSIPLSIDLLYLVMNPFGILIICSIVLFLLKLSIQRQLVDTDLFYLITSLTIVSTILIPNLQYYFLITTYRSVIPVAGVTIIQVFCDCQIIFNRYKIRLTSLNQRNKPEEWKRHFFRAILIINVFNSLLYIAQTQNGSIYPGSYDYQEMVWITQNIDKNSLIANEPSFFGLFLTGFDYRNVVFVRQLTIFHAWDSSYYKERASRSMEIFTNPTNYTNVRDIMLTYGISYIQLTNLTNLFDYTTYKSIPKPIDINYQVGNYSVNPYIELVWNQGNSAVFKLK